MVTRLFSITKVVVKVALFLAPLPFILAPGETFARLSMLIPQRIVTIPVERPEPSTQELLRNIPPRYGVPPVLLAAIIHQESGGKKDAIRFEDVWMTRARKITNNPQQQRMYASSHGLAQVAGWWAKEYDISWSDLYDPQTNLEVACAILKKGLDRHAGKERYAQLRAALAEYNGSTAYADAVLGAVGRKLIAEEL